MGSRVNESTESRWEFCTSIVRIFVIEVLVLIALAGAIIGYLNWSSEVAWSEFLAASQMAAAGSHSALRAVRHKLRCGRDARARVPSTADFA